MVCAATIYGEQDEEEIDRNLAVRNVRVWNAWATQAMPVVEIAHLRDGAASDLDGAGEWQGMKAEAVEAFGARLGADARLPDPSGMVDFSNTEFAKTVVLANSVFTQAAFFDSATFAQDANFQSATFTQASYFGSTIFKKGAHFFSATFAHDANFSKAIFTQGADFSSTMFTHGAYFRSATFSQDVYFSSGTFNQDANFSKANFAGTAFFDSANFFGFPKFMETVFEGAVGFLDCQFENATSFRNAQFRATYPVFVGTDMHFTNTFTACETAEFSEVDNLGNVTSKEVRRLWPIDLADDQNKLEAARLSVSTIRHAVAQQGKPEDEHFFFRKEMALAARIGGFWQRLPYRVFGVVSDFGYSIARPAKWLLAVLTVPAVIYTVLIAGPVIAGVEGVSIFQGIGLSIANTFAFLGFRGLYFGAEILAELDAWVKVLGAVQTVLGFVFLFFLGLGLRTRFRLR